ncbi:E3 ubiquitin-protein ligase RNF34 isoform X2 [Colletes gigas]|uniref:E3 ubiquitin-protein ligase RNF34 isoform X2 n=1 Tax=Colletes gigas TaxID=935657 RepID=UPI001C9B1867|nr:E3 ubiquitin-protein ligase RNF34 isoform X2 [Colletes gigas]
MACEACNVKFNFFTRKKQCTDCSRYFCSACVIKRLHKTLNCTSCGILSQRPLMRNQIMQMRSKDLLRYLLGNKVSIKGCIEKEDLIELVMIFANGNSDYKNIEIPENTRAQNISSSASSQLVDIEDEHTYEPCTREHEHEPCAQEHEPSVQEPEPYAQEHEPYDQGQETSSMRIDQDEIIDISESTSSPNEEPEPVISEEVEISEISSTQHHSDTFTNIPMWSDHVKLSDINNLSELEYLSVKQLKNLLSINRVDYKGCVERRELLDRASRLWQEHKQSKTAKEILDENLCKICWDEPVECVILECGHIACCLNCGKQMSECPICKQYIVRVVRFFKV